MRTLIVKWALVLCAFALPISSLLAQLPTPSPTPTLQVSMPTAPPNLAVAVVTYGSAGAAVSQCPQGIFDRVAIQPDETVQVTIQYPATQALQTVLAEPLDGGTITFPSDGSVISAKGILTFTFKASHDPGLNQVSLRQGSQELGLQFWVMDTQNPQNNPPALSASNPIN